MGISEFASNWNSKAVSRKNALAMSEDQVFSDFVTSVDIAGAIVIEVGGAISGDLVAASEVSAWCSVDPRNLACAGRNAGVVAARAENLPFAAASADVIFSSNAFQFVDFPVVLQEARRVLKHGGILYAHFGPIWSGPDGHQLEYVQYAGRELVFWRDTLVPEWAHLSYEPEELHALLCTGIDDELASLIVHHIYFSKTINRFFFEDYLECVLDSGMYCLEVATSTDLDYSIDTPMYASSLQKNTDVAELAERIMTSTGRRRQLGIRDVRLMLRRP